MIKNRPLIIIKYTSCSSKDNLKCTYQAIGMKTLDLLPFTFKSFITFSVTSPSIGKVTWVRGGGTLALRPHKLYRLRISEPFLNLENI